MSAGRNLITLFSSVNNLSRSFSSLRPRRLRTMHRAHRANAAHAHARRIDTHRTNSAHASIGAACSDSIASARDATTVIATTANGMHATCEGIAHVAANRCRFSRRTSAFARKLRELFATFRLASRPPRRAMRRRAGRTHEGHGLAQHTSHHRQPAKKNPRRFRRGFRHAHGNAISVLRFPAARHIRRGRTGR